VRNFSARSIIGPAILLMLAASCRFPPRREIAKARADLDDAMRAQAPIYAPSSFQEARRALEGARRLVKEKRYADAKLLAIESSSRARGAIGISDENRQKMLAALQLKIQSTDRELTDAAEETKIAQARGVDEAARQLFGAEMTGARARQDEARKRLADRNIVDARKWADDADVAAATLLRDIRFSIARKQSEPVPKKRARRPSSRATSP
jgi:hypothetical protein